MQWTKEQSDAINHDTAHDGSAIVSAAAGSGKTAVLVEHVLRMITDETRKIPADRLAVMTFTNKAADELTARLKAALRIMPAQSDWLVTQLIRLEDASISTISAFCLDIVRQNADYFGLTANFSVMDEVQRQVCLSSAMEKTMKTLYEAELTANKQAVNSLHTMTKATSAKKITELIAALADTALSFPFPEQWLDEKAALYDTPAEFLAYLLSFVDIREKAQTLIQLAEDNLSLTGEETTAYPKIKAEFLIISGWQSLDFNNTAKLQEQLSMTLPDARYGKSYSPEDKQAVAENRKQIKAIHEDLCDLARRVMSFQAACAKLHVPVHLLVRLTKMFMQYFREEKVAIDSVDFTDIEQYCLTLLTTNPTVAERLRLKYHEIIVDEFQDSNSIQYAIFKAVSRNERNLYFVGDIKQSIYRFRKADPSVFLQVMKNDSYKTLLLNRNFRSSKEVIHGVNHLFSHLMTKTCGGVDYNAENRLIEGLGVSGGDQALMELCILDKQKNKDAGQTDVEAETRYIARRIVEFVKSGYTITDKAGTVRPVEYGDIAIIARSLTAHEETIKSILREWGIPVAGGSGGDYLKLQEIDLMLKLLCVIDDPYKDYELLHVLMSPVFGFTADEVASIRLVGVAQPLYANLRRVIRGQVEQHLLEKIHRFLDTLALWRAIAENHAVAHLLQDIYDSGMILPLIAAGEAPTHVDANLKLLMHYANVHGAHSGGTLGGFLQFMQSIADKAKKLPMAEITGNEETGVVRLMTIHGAKGLEFPICFVAFTGKRHNDMDKKQLTIFEEHVGIAPYVTDKESLVRFPTLMHYTAASLLEKEMLSEEVRILYVAATRARDKLVFTGSAKFAEGIPAPEKNSYLNWLCKALSTHKAPVRQSFPESEDAAAFRQPPDTLPEPDKAQVDAILRGMQHSYARKPLTSIPRKLTATQIGVAHQQNSGYTDSGDEPSLFPRIPSFLKGKTLTGKKRGDAYHKAMELIDFQAGNYLDQLAALKTRFTEEEYQAINPADICRFFASPLGQRAIAAQVEKEFPLYTEIDFAEIGLPDLDSQFIERPFVQGIADMFFIEQGEIILVDYKTNRHTTAHALIAMYRNQLRIYQKALKEMLQMPVKECWLYAFALGEIRVI